MKLRRALALVLFLLVANTVYVAAFPTPTVVYMGNVVLHLLLGVSLAAGLIHLLLRDPELRQRIPLAVGFGLLAAGFGLYLAIAGATRDHNWALAAHIAMAYLGLAALIVAAWRGKWASPKFRQWLAALTAAAVIVPAAARWQQHRADLEAAVVKNPLTAPVSYNDEGDGAKSPFFPSSSTTNTHRTIPSTFFMDSKRCGDCHKDVYEQWQSSMHHFASFNNQFYRKAIENMQDISGTQGSKLCAGCHDHAVFFNGRFDRPIKEQIDTPEAQNGLGCTSCHAITAIHSSMGNGDFTVEYPPLHELASSHNPMLKNVDTFLTYLDPEPHRRIFLKPFMASAEFCSACHKVHLEVPTNHYRWQRGFDDYDNWQASGVSGEGARSFYYPDHSMACADCHMPLVKSNDPGNINGFVHSHRFPAANTAVATANEDAAQLAAEKKFLTSGFITVDVFAASPVADAGKQTEMQRRSGEGPQLSSTMAVGEEAEQAGPVVIREVGKVAAPLNEAATRFEPGSTVRVDVVVRTRKIGHFFPGGTVDAPDAWLEVQACDETGKTIFWSGKVEDNGHGPVEPGAHFYRSYLVDGHGNPINKRNAWQSRAVMYVHLIPPGAADVAHYRIKIPKDARGKIRVTAKLNYRKFSWYFTQYAYAGKTVSGDAAPDHDDRTFSFAETNIPKNVSGKLRTIPDVPIVTLASAETDLNVGAPGSTPDFEPVVRKQDRERWNDWGIGMLLQGDLKGAEYAFQKVTEADPNYADGWLNVARALIQEGEEDAAKPYLQKALALGPNLARVHFFEAMVQKADGDFDGALASLRECQAQYPRDRVVLNQIGRILFLKRDYAGAVKALNGVMAVDPEDLQGHYTLMLCYRGLGDMKDAQREQELFLRFKADEASQAITGKTRMMSPEDNNERQPLHDHESVPLKDVAWGAGR